MTKLNNYKHALKNDIHIIESSLSIKKLNDVLKHILRDFCNIDIIGFNNYNNTFWSKIIKNKKCILYTEIKIVINENNNSLIIINHNYDYFEKIGVRNKIEFNYSIKEGLYLYENSAFTKYVFDSY